MDDRGRVRTDPSLRGRDRNDPSGLPRVRFGFARLLRHTDTDNIWKNMTFEERLVHMAQRIPLQTGHALGAGSGIPIGQSAPCGTPLCLRPYTYARQTGLWETVLCCISVVDKHRQSTDLTKAGRTIWSKLAMKQRNRHMAKPETILASPDKMTRMADALRRCVDDDEMQLEGGVDDQDRACLRQLADEFLSYITL